MNWSARCDKFRLTKVEARILNTLQAATSPMTRDELMAAVLGRKFGSDPIIATHIWRIRKKLAGSAFRIDSGAKGRHSPGYSLVTEGADA